ncbi:MAG TPA: ATP-binding SpoIIE family protein phosphatase [Terriglobales bacterium]|nr:ATP-binding SpoIIE family protein phosphatase [Terriglobales bacterium]
MSREQISVPIAENTHVSEARRASARLAHDLGFNPVSQEHAAIVVTELARNMLLHAAGGEIVLQPGSGARANVWIDVLALDKGNGIADISRALSDGYSSAGTRGTGFGAVSRLSAVFEVYSKPGEGTAVLARVVPGKQHEETQSATGSVCVPVAGETRCGDAWECQDQAGRRLIMLADGLGHGPYASDAAEEALAAFRANQHKSPGEIIEATHGHLEKTRGAAVAVAEINFERQIVRYSGIGNIAGVIVANGNTRSMISHNGIVGHRSESIQELAFPWERSAFLIMHSDGINTRWSLDRYPGLQSKHASLIAGVLYRDFKRTRDDATVVVSRETRAA